MKAVVVSPNTAEELRLVTQLMKKIGIATKTLSLEELEDVGLHIMMKDVDRFEKSQPPHSDEQVAHLMRVEFLDKFNSDLEMLPDKPVKSCV